MLLVTIEGLPYCIGPDLFKSVTTLSMHAGMVALPPPPYVPRACASDPVHTSLASVLALMRSLRRVPHNSPAALCQHWIDPAVPNAPFVRFRVALAAALATAMDVRIDEHILVHVKKSPHECFETLAASSGTDVDFSTGSPQASSVMMSRTLGGIFVADAFLDAAARDQVPVTPFPHRHTVVIAPAFADDNPTDATALARTIMSSMGLKGDTDLSAQ